MSRPSPVGELKTKPLQEQTYGVSPTANHESGVQANHSGKRKGAVALMTTAPFLKNNRLLDKKLLHFPGVTSAKKFAEVAPPALGDDVLDLLVHHIFIARQIIPGAKNSDGCGETGPMFHVGEQEGVGRPWMVGVVHYEVALRDPVAKLDDFDIAIRFPADALIAVFAEDQRLAVLQLHYVFAARIALGQREPCAIIENVAVLKDLHECGTLVRGGMFERFFQLPLEDVHGACHKGCFRPDCQ